MKLAIGWCIRVLAVVSLCCLAGCPSKARQVRPAEQESRKFVAYLNIGLDLKRGKGVDVEPWYEYIEVSRAAYANKWDAAYMLAFMHQHGRFTDRDLRAAHYWHFRHLMHGAGSGAAEKMVWPLRIWTRRDRFSAWFRARGFLDGWARKARPADGMAWFLHWASVGDANGLYPTWSNQLACVRFLGETERYYFTESSAPPDRDAGLPETDRYAGARGLRTLLNNVRHLTREHPDDGDLARYEALANMTRDQVVALYRSARGAGREGQARIIQAADWGLVEAQLEAAGLFARSGNLADAHFYRLRAALGGDGGAAFDVAVDYEKARGTEKDLLEAWAWYRLAEHSGHGKPATDALGSLLSPERAAEWDRADKGLVKPNVWFSSSQRRSD